mmetsp:Transcript_32972/g.110063  ORF Transcript_32972/g.110063 Transcript_32972/m.110063 type:complete len:634 (+) Transcript_32972:649-2550(+)
MVAVLHALVDRARLEQRAAPVDGARLDKVNQPQKGDAVAAVLVQRGERLEPQPKRRHPHAQRRLLARLRRVAAQRTAGLGGLGRGGLLNQPRVRVEDRSHKGEEHSRPRRGEVRRLRLKHLDAAQPRRLQHTLGALGRGGRAEGGACRVPRRAAVRQHLVQHDRERERVGEVDVQVGDAEGARDGRLLRARLEVAADVVVDPAQEHLHGPVLCEHRRVLADQAQPVELRHLARLDRAEQRAAREVPHELQRALLVGRRVHQLARREALHAAADGGDGVEAQRLVLQLSVAAEGATLWQVQRARVERRRCDAQHKFGQQDAWRRRLEDGVAARVHREDVARVWVGLKRPVEVLDEGNALRLVDGSHPRRAPVSTAPSACVGQHSDARAQHLLAERIECGQIVGCSGEGRVPGDRICGAVRHKRRPARQQALAEQRRVPSHRRQACAHAAEGVRVSTRRALAAANTGRGAEHRAVHQLRRRRKSVPGGGTGRVAARSEGRRGRRGDGEASTRERGDGGGIASAGFPRDMHHARLQVLAHGEVITAVRGRARAPGGCAVGRHQAGRGRWSDARAERNCARRRSIEISRDRMRGRWRCLRLLPHGEDLVVAIADRHRHGVCREAGGHRCRRRVEARG